MRSWVLDPKEVTLNKNDKGRSIHPYLRLNKESLIYQNISKLSHIIFTCKYVLSQGFEISLNDK